MSEQIDIVSSFDNKNDYNPTDVDVNDAQDTILEENVVEDIDDENIEDDIDENIDDDIEDDIEESYEEQESEQDMDIMISAPLMNMLAECIVYKMAALCKNNRDSEIRLMSTVFSTLCGVMIGFLLVRC
jgi:hypothetical protein